MNKKLLLISLVMAVFLLPVAGLAMPQDWTVNWPGHSGTITINPDGSGTAVIDNYGEQSFSWEMNADNTGVAHYWWWSIPFTYNEQTQTISSENIPGATLIPVPEQPVIPQPEVTEDQSYGFFIW